MAVLTVDVGGSPLSLDCQRGGHAAPRRVGPKTIGNSGAEESSVRGELMVVPIVTAPILLATAATVRSLFAIGNQVPCDGDIFNKAGTITCSGEITDELQVTGDSVVLSLTLFEVASVAAGVTTISQFLLTSVESPDSGGDPTILVGYPDSFSYPGDSSLSYRALASATPVTGGSATTTGGTPERSWLSLPLNAGIAWGTPYIVIETSMDPGPSSGTTVWGQMDTYAKLYQKRGATTIAGPITSSAVAVSFGGGTVTMTFPGSIVWIIAADDQLLIEFYSTIDLQTGVSDNGQRQLISYGMVPGPRPAPRLVIGGNLTSAP